MLSLHVCAAVHTTPLAPCPTGRQDSQRTAKEDGVFMQWTVYNSEGWCKALLNIEGIGQMREFVGVSPPPQES